jgi:hypothetical protein
LGIIAENNIDIELLPAYLDIEMSSIDNLRLVLFGAVFIGRAGSGLMR